MVSFTTLVATGTHHENGRMTRPSSTSNRQITVYGAYGHTGRFVVDELRERGWTPVLAGRNPDRLAEVAERSPGSPVRVATPDDPDSLDRALAGSAAVVNTAGPFEDTAGPVEDAALRAGIHYLDVTAETLVALDSFADAARDTRARELGVVIAPSTAFYGALGDLMASAATEGWDDVEDLTVAFALDSWKPTRGTLLAGERRAGRRVVLRDGGLDIIDADQPAPRGRWDFPEPFGKQDVVGEFSTTDVITIARHLPVRQVTTLASSAPLGDLQQPYDGGPDRVDARGRSAQRFVVDVVATRAGERARVVARGRDIYAFTAPIVVEALERILDGRARTTGIATAGQLFDAADFLRALPLEHLSVTVDRDRGYAGQ